MKVFKIGMRNVKTAVAVLICVLIKVILLMINEEFATVYFSPFFAGIAACYSMQQSPKMSVKNAKIRGIGTIVGGLYGMAISALYMFVVSLPVFIEAPVYLKKLVEYSIVVLAILPLVNLTVLLHVTPATFITCLTFLSVTVSPRNGVPPIPFAIDRIVSTSIGLGISLIVNLMHLPRKKNVDVLFITGLDGTLLNMNKELSGFTKYKLNSMINNGASITVATTRTPASLIKVFDGININQPMIIMNGAAVYSLQTHTYGNIKRINEEAVMQLEKYFLDNEINAFAHVILDDVLHIYHQKLSNDGEKKYYYDRKNDYFKNYIRGKVEDNEPICFYILVDTCERIEKISNDIRNMECAMHISVTTYPFQELDGYYNLKINSSEASKQNAINELKLSNTSSYVVAFGGRDFDIPMMKQADYAIALENADEEVKEIADFIIPSSSPERLIKEMEKIYYARKTKQIFDGSSEEKEEVA